SSRRLLAYVVPATASASPAELRRAARERLPDYMVPAQVVLLDALPRTAHGKVNRSTLPSPTPERSLSDDGFVAPQSGVEEVLSGIWGEVLGLERVSVHDDFFDLGGHSLLATQVISRIDRSLAIELPVRAVFEQPTIARLARRVDAEQRSKEGLTAPPIVPVDRHGELPLSFAQERMCFLHQLAPHSSQYNVASCIRLNGELEISVLRACFTELIRRHEALRTTFPVVDGQPIQRIAPPWADNLELTLADLSALAAIECESAIHDLARRAAARPFDLQHGPLLRIELLRLAPDDHVLLLGMHHIVSDGWSVGVLIREMATLYAAYRAGEPSPLPVLGVQYADFAAWQRRWLTGWTLERQLSYWRQHLDGAPETLALPTDRPRKAVRSARGDSRPLRLTPELSQAVAALARQRGASLFMTLLAAFEALLHRICASDDLVIGSPIANRNRRETEDLIGFFVNALVLRADLTGDPSFAEHLSQVRETTLDAYMHQDLPFEKLVEELRPARDLGHTPLFQVVFGLQNLPLDLTLPELRLEPFPVPGSEAKFDLTWTLSEIEPGTSGGHLAGWIEYSSDLFDTTTIARLERQFETVLTNAVAEPERHLSQLELLQPAQRAQVLREWNAAPPVPDTPQRLETLFIDQARQRPEAIAVVWDDEHLSYATLARRSRALALHLRQLGVDNEVRVGLCLRRSPDLVVAILGVLQAGGAYVPIDPSYPADRIAFLAEDAGFTVLVRDEQTTTAIPQPRDRELRVITVDSSRDLSETRHDPSTPQPARGSVD
ncbi:MAG: condensation domain-containing protein, partial [Acidobacteriota bacterium]